MIAQPVAESERAEILDVLRGFALLGIFLAHVPGFSGWDYLAPVDQLALDPGSDATLQFLRELFIRSKFYSLFSLLFGIGFAIQVGSAERQGIGFAARFGRRQLGLLALGVVHSVFWHGDILLTYGLLGLLLVPMARWPAGRVLRWSAGAFALRGLWGAITFGLADGFATIGNAAVGDGSGGTDIAGAVGSAMAGYYSPAWREMLGANASFLPMKWLLVLYEGKLFSILGFFLLGVGLGKKRVHERIGALSRELGRVAVAAGAIGLAGNAILALLWPVVPRYPPSVPGVAVNLLYAIAVPSLAVAMAASLAWLWARDLGRPLLALFAAPGRMALTTYLTQTAIGIGTFYGVGLGLRGSVSLTTALTFGVVVFGLQAALARVWLGAFRYGPVEWLWRCSTYQRLLPLRRSIPPARVGLQPRG